MQDQSNQVSRDDDQQTHKVELLAAVVLHVLVSIAPDALTVIQVSAECERDPDTSDDREEVEAALNVLVTDGLACKQDDGFTATHPAVRANELSF